MSEQDIEVIDLSIYSYKDRCKDEVNNKLSKIRKYTVGCQSIEIRKSQLNNKNIGVLVLYENNTNEKIKVKYKYFDNENFVENVKNKKAVDLSFTYIDNSLKLELKNNKETLCIINEFKAFWAYFDGSFDFKYIEFMDKKLDFEGSVFSKGTSKSGHIHFLDCKFNSNEINFCENNFVDTKILFKDCIFNDVGIMVEYSVLSSSYFQISKCYFGYGKISFRRSYSINSEININESNIDNIEFNFNNSKLDKVIFSDISFKTKSYMKFDCLNWLRIINCQIETILYLDGNAEYKLLSLNNTNIDGKVYIDWNKNKIANAIEKPNYLLTNYAEKSKQYQLLKNNFNAIGYYEDEDKALVKYMDNYLLSKGYVWKKRIAHNIGAYGTNPSSIVLWALLIMFIFSIIYLLSGLRSFSIVEVWNLFNIDMFKQYFNVSAIKDIFTHFIDCIYFSGITFLTIGYGDIQPTSIFLKFCTILEGGLGVLLMSYLSVAIVRKILR